MVTGPMDNLLRVSLGKESNSFPTASLDAGGCGQEGDTVTWHFPQGLQGPSSDDLLCVMHHGRIVRGQCG